MNGLEFEKFYTKFNLRIDFLDTQNYEPIPVDKRDITVMLHITKADIQMDSISFVNKTSYKGKYS